MVERKALEIACKKKEKFRCLLSNIKEKFKQLVADSKLLTQPFHRDYFQLNEKFSVLPVKETQSEAKKLRLNLELEHENSLLDLQQVNYFVDRGIIPKLKVKGILEDKFVKTLVNRESHRSIFRDLLDELLSKKHPKPQFT
ncbi:uncharacterized protein LOC112685945 [Sipha flava]|uniref:Uncharacterized protein LOC112685945 n=1 Tax=Sipha flava TaxID=143950 RepID=A0A8B8FS71_9HEMI|nr:uncharacterized protein LOC112685945 [Sipha flava]